MATKKSTWVLFGIFRAGSIALLLLVASLARAQSNEPTPAGQLAFSSVSECPLERALDFHVVQALKQGGVTDEQFEALAAAGEIEATFPEVCIAELNYAAANPDTKCQIRNGQMFSQLLSYVAVAGYLFAVTEDAPTYRVNLRVILRTFLTSVPHQCWFQGMQLPPANQPSVSVTPLTQAQCAQLRANYQACKSEAESAAKACTVTPWKHNCAITIPTCILPPGC